jgi:hypothetical protein
MKSIREQRQPVSAQAAGPIDSSAAKREITVAWEQYRESTIRHYKDGFAFGRVCYEWRSAYTAQGSRSGKGFNRLLAELAIPKTTAYRWIRRYELKNGLRTKRNEVEAKHRTVHAVIQKKSQIMEGRVCFYFSLDEAQRYQFEEDVNALGGCERVSEMIVDFVSWKASEKRAAETKWPHEGMARTAASA